MYAITIFLTLVRLNQSIKYMPKVATKLKKQSTTTMPTLFCCLTSYKVTSFLDFFVANMLFFSREKTHVLHPAGVYLLKVNKEYNRRNYGISSRLTTKTLEQSQLMLFQYLLVLIRLQKFLQSFRKPNWNEIQIKNKIYCLLWTDFAMCSSVFVVDFEEVSAHWEARERIDYRKIVDSSAGAMWSLNKGRCDNPFCYHTHLQHPIWSCTLSEHFQDPC